MEREGEMMVLEILVFGYLFSLVENFIVPSENEPVCAGVDCYHNKVPDPLTCKCVCPPDPDVRCLDIEPPTFTSWPYGQYALPASMYGCPERDWSTRYINLTSGSKDIIWQTSGSIYKITSYDHTEMSHLHVDGLHILGPYSRTSFQFNFCVREDDMSNFERELAGKFCLFDVENDSQCKSGFQTGNITFRGEGINIDIRGFPRGPDSNGEFVVNICCKEDEYDSLSDVLPNYYPFAIIKNQDFECPVVKEMDVSEDTVQFPKDSVHIVLSGTDMEANLTFCHYQPRFYGIKDLSDGPNQVVLFPGSLSDGRPVYSSAYEESPSNLPQTVVGDGTMYSKVFYTLNQQRPWIQIDLQQFVEVSSIVLLNEQSLKVIMEKLYGLYVSKNQWDFFTRGAPTCFFGWAYRDFFCRRPIRGQYVTLVIESGLEDTMEAIVEFHINGFAFEPCGRSLGMMSGEIKEYQIETSSNSVDIPYTRALYGDKGWCASKEDQDSWIMIDMITPHEVEGVALHGWYQSDRMFITSFHVEYGFLETNMTFYTEDNMNPKTFNIDESQNVYGIQKFWFMKAILTRFVKIKGSNKEGYVPCLKMELIGCKMNSRRSARCNEDTHGLMDFGFSSLRHTKVEVDNLGGVCENQTVDSMKECHQITEEKSFLGNVYDSDTRTCCLYNVSIENRHFRHFWQRTDSTNVITSERLCLSGLMMPHPFIGEGYFLPPILGVMDYLYSPLFPSRYPEGISLSTEISTPPNLYIKITVVYISLAVTLTKTELRQTGNSYLNPSTCRDKLEIDIGTGKAIQITSGNQERFKYASFISKGSRILIQFRSCFHYASTEDVMYQFKYETVDHPGCGIDGTTYAECTDTVAYLASHLYPAPFTASARNLWKIRGKLGQFIQLSFIDLDIQDSVNLNAYIEVYDIDLSDRRESVFGRFTKTTMPREMLKSSWHMMDIEFRSSQGLTGRGFFGIYEIRDVQSFQMISEGCEPFWNRFERSCYKLFQENSTNFKTAEDICMAERGHLVSVNTPDEMTFLHSMLISSIGDKKGIIDKAYIGLRKVGVNQQFNDFVWTSGEPLTYTAWFLGTPKEGPQPDGFRDQQCTAIILTKIHNPDVWFDVPCNYDEIDYFICEKQDQNPDVTLSQPTGPWNLPDTETSDMKHNHFKCDNGEYVSKLAVCDNIRDCYDKTDEKNCSNHCSSSQFRCTDGKCIHMTFYCDHIVHCSDGSDEECDWSICSNEEWKCSNNQCIPSEQRCDTVENCFDGSDEQSCDSCSGQSFQCYDGSCIAESLLCDGIADCPGMFFEDERSERCRTTNHRYSCEDWWMVGARKDGMYLVDFGKGNEGAISVYCVFEQLQGKVKVSTHFYYYEIGKASMLIAHVPEDTRTYRFHNDIIQRVLHDSNYSCTQNIQMACYYQNSMKRFRPDLAQACGNSCNCIGDEDWLQADINIPLFDNVTLTDPGVLPVNGYRIPIDVLSDESFYSVEVGPVICKSELPDSATHATEYLCKEHQVYNFRDRCLLSKNGHNNYNGCRDMSHLDTCANFTCPEGYFKCTNSFCIASDLVCDGINHCMDGADEKHCDTMLCPGLYRCQHSTTCLTNDKLCDNIKHCVYGDDENDCMLDCPLGCHCDGLVYTCHNTNASAVLASCSRDIRKLDLTSSTFLENTLLPLDFKLIAHLILRNCRIERLEQSTFSNTSNLLHLDLSFNRIKTLRSKIFYGLMRLQTLNLAGNYLLEVIEPKAFLSLRAIKGLDLIDTQISQIKDDAFFGLENLETLNITSNQIYTIEDHGFRGLQALTSLDISINNIETFSLGLFDHLESLQSMKTDLYVFCCLKPESVLDENCYPHMDEFSSCSDLMRNEILRVCIWVISISAFAGNIGVIVYRLFYDRKLLRKPHGFFIFNLSISDMLMGIYLGIIAIADLEFKGDYILHDISWRNSMFCKIAGVIGTVSSEASVNFIMLITIECFLMVKFPFGNRRITYRIAKITSFVCWVAVTFLGVFPLLYTEYFSDEFYSSTAVCLALPFTRRKTSGWEYSVAVFIFYNTVAFCVIAWCQYSIYNIAKSNSRIKSKQSGQDLALARRLFLVVFTDFLCWFPVGVMGILALAGHIFPSEVYSWVAVFVMPVNSALNPFLYTFSAVMAKKPFIVTAITERLHKKSQKGTRKRNDKLPRITFGSVFVDSVKELDLDSFILGELLSWRKLTPKDSFYVMTQIVGALSYIHQKSFCLSDRMTQNTVIVCMEDKTIVQVRIISRLKDMTSEGDSSRDVEDIGNISKFMLKHTTTL